MVKWFTEWLVGTVVLVTAAVVDCQQTPTEKHAEDVLVRIADDVCAEAAPELQPADAALVLLICRQVSNYVERELEADSGAPPPVKRAFVLTKRTSWQSVQAADAGR